MKKIAYLFLMLLLMSCGEKSPSEHFTSAKNSIDSQAYDAAIIALKNTLQIEPTHAEARYLLGKIYFDKKQYLNAEKELDRAFRLKYNANEVLPLLTQAYYKSEIDLPLVELELDELKLSNENQALALFYQLLANIRLEKENEIETISNKIKQLDSNSNYKTLALAYTDSIKNNSEAALEHLNNALAKESTQAEGLKLKAQLLLANNDIDNAITTYQTYVEAYPNDLAISFVLARLLMDNNQSKTAEPIIDKLLSVNSEHVLLNQLKSLARFNEQDTKQALAFAEKSLTSSPTSLPTRLIAGVSAYTDKDFTKAHQHLSFIAEQLPTNHPALRILASSQLALGLSIDASETMNKLDILTPEDNNLISSIGMALIPQGENEKVKSIINKVSQENISTEALAKLGLLKLSIHDVSGITNLEDALEKVLKEEPSDNTLKAKQDVEIVLATAYLSTRQYNKALALAKKIQNEQPDSIRGEMLAAKVNIQLKSFDEAKAFYNLALAKQPNNPEIKLALIKLQLTKTDQNKKQIFEGLQSLTSAYPTYSPALALYYVFAKEKGNQGEVIKALEQTLSKNNEEHNLKVTLAKMYFSEKQFKKVIEVLTSLNALPNKPSDYWPLLAKSYRFNNEAEKAISTYNKWLEQAPQNKDALLTNILVLKKQAKYNEALTLSEQLISMTGETVIINGLRAELLLLNGDITLAKKTFYALPDKVQELPKVKGLLGRIQFEEKNYKSALTNLTAAYSENTDSQTSRLVYQCYERLKQNDNAASFLLNHLNKQPDDVWALLVLALKQVYTDKSKAIITYQKVIKNNNNIALAHNNLAFLIAEQGNLEQAIVHGNKAINLEPENADYLDTLGKILLDKKRIPEAVKHLSKAVENTKGKTPEPIYINYIEALIADNQLLLAKRKFNGFTFSQTSKKKLEQLTEKLNTK